MRLLFWGIKRQYLIENKLIYLKQNYKFPRRNEQKKNLILVACKTYLISFHKCFPFKTGPFTDFPEITGNSSFLKNLF